jgi:pimeloyl-ACP methyl ester carboxylesterase
MTATSAEQVTDRFRSAPDRMLPVGAGEVALRSFGTGPAVLFVHGWPVSGATFRRLLPHLAEHVTCHVIDLPGAGAGRRRADVPVSVRGHVAAVREVVDGLALDDVAVVGHDSGGLIARHALAGDPRVRAWALLDTEQPQGLTWRFRSFLLARHMPGFATALPRVLAAGRLRRNPLVLGGAFADTALLDGEFDELFLRPIVQDPDRRRAAVELLDSFDTGMVRDLPALHARIDAPVLLVWGRDDPFFPVGRAEAMAGTFPDARLVVIDGARLFAHEERPAEVAAALLPALARDGAQPPSTSRAP